MIISEQQIFQLINIAEDYARKIQFMIENNMANGNPSDLMNAISELVLDIRNQQSEELKEIKDAN